MARKPTKERIIEFVRDNPGTTSVGVEKAIDITYGTSYAHLSDLVKSGQLKRKVFGRHWEYHYYTPDKFDTSSKIKEIDENQSTLDSYSTLA